MLQPPASAQEQEAGLVIDIDVFTKQVLACDDLVLDEYLPRMRWLKNKVFFDLLTSDAIEGFRQE
jgi:uncharacterized protein (TIGR04255 family)